MERVTFRLIHLLLASTPNGIVAKVNMKVKRGPARSSYLIPSGVWSQVHRLPSHAFWQLERCGRVMGNNASLREKVAGPDREQYSVVLAELWCGSLFHMSDIWACLVASGGAGGCGRLWRAGIVPEV